MDKLGAFESYVSAVRSGSLSGAARQRQLSQPAISQQISSLEAHFQTKLLRRGRKGVQMTPAGELLYKHAVVVLEELASLSAGLETLTERVAGQLVVTANPGFSQHVLSEVIVGLKGMYPDLDVSLRTDVRVLDLESEGIDVALRWGRAGAGRGMVRKVAMMSVLHVATPDYLDGVGRPRHPNDLIGLDYIQFKAGKDQTGTLLRRAKQSVQAPIKIGFSAQSPDLMTKALMGNLGFAKVPEFFVAKALQEGRLEVVLPQWTTPATELFIVFPDKKRRTPSLLAFLNVLFEHLGRLPGIELVPSANPRLRQTPAVP
jgi:DNA-binding transcriptional LysR family regulator